MRVIGGSARGRVLKGPPRTGASGRPGTRPSSDLIRGVIFNMLDAMSADYSRVLDLYAGTGALGIEALSRGDGTADFVEQSAAACGVIRANLEITGFGGRARVHRMLVSSAPSRLSGAYTLVLADPPYYDSEAVAAVEAVARSPLVGRGSVLVFEHHYRMAVPEALDAMALHRERRHGDTVVSIYRQEEAS